jgi:hypothetical protein
VVGVVLIGLSVLILALVLGKGIGEARPTSLPTPLAPTLDVASPTSPQVVADTPALPPPTDPPTLAPPPTEPRAVSLPDLFQPGVRIDEQAVGSLYTGPQSRVIASIGPDRVLATRTRQGQEFSDTSLLQSRHYLGNDGSAPWLPFDVVDELLAGQRPAFGISSEEPDGTLELRGTSDYGVLIDGKLVTVPALEVHSSQGDVYTVLNDPGNRYVLRFEGGPGASGYDRYVTAFATEGAGLPPTAEPVRLFEVVYPGSDGVSLRAGPDVSQTELAVLSLGTRLSAEGAPVRGSGAVVWWPVSTAAQRGWVAEVYNNWRLIKPVMAAGDWVVVANPDETGNINLRDDGCQAVAILSRGTRLTVTGEGEVKCDDPSAGIVSEGRRWWPVRSSLSEEGWVADFSSDNKRTLVAPEWYAELVAQLP